MYKRILVPTDGSEITAKAARAAIQMASENGGHLFVISTTEPLPFSGLGEMQAVSPRRFHESRQQLAVQRVNAVQELAQAQGVPCTTHTAEALHPWEAILNFSREQECDLIVMASHGRRGVSAVLLGSETQRVLTHSSIPVLVVK